jgi:hypothetical protein
MRMPRYLFSVLAGLMFGQSSTFTLSPELKLAATDMDLPNAVIPRSRRRGGVRSAPSQRQIRKDRRRSWAAGNRFAFA